MAKSVKHVIPEDRVCLGRHIAPLLRRMSQFLFVCFFVYFSVVCLVGGFCVVLLDVVVCL